MPHALDHEQLFIYDQLNDLFKVPWYRRYQRDPIVYLHGPVGCGKSYVIQRVLARHRQCKIIEKHSHQWSTWLQHQLKVSHQKDPLFQIAKTFYRQADGIMIDDLMMDNVATFQLMARWALLGYQLRKLVWITANALPNDLNDDPVIQSVNQSLAVRLTKQCQLLSLSGRIDYRLQKKPVRYFHTQPHHQQIQTLFEHVPGTRSNMQLYRLGRHALICRAIKPGFVWCDLSKLCLPPLSRYEYAQLHDLKMLFIEDDRMQWSADLCYNWVYLLDHCFDAGIQIAFSTFKTDEQIHDQLTHRYPFGERAYSRLVALCADESGDKRKE